MSSNAVAANASANFRTLGALWFVYGLLRIVAAIGLLVYSATATLMFGALLNRVANPFMLMDIFHILYIGAIVLALLCGALGLLAGMALMSGGRSSRTLGLLAAFFSLCNLPFGTTLGIYTLVVLLPVRTK